VTHSPRIAIFYADAGAGHRRAAEAIAQPLIEHGATVALHDALRFTHPLFRAVYAGGGLSLIIRLPRLYQLAYHISDQPSVDRVLRGPRYRTQQISTRALRRTIETFQPDAIVCTHYLSAELCAGWRRSGQLRVPLYTVITDFDPHFMWQHTGTDGYCAPTEAARDRLIHNGVDPAIITVTGIPIDPRFAALPDRVAAARRLQLDPDRPVVLIMGGGLGVGLMGSIGQALRAQPLEAQLVFITGHNHALRRKLKAMSLSQKEKWIVRGFVNNMPDWLALADVAISKAGGLAGSELLAAGVPTIIPCRLTGHEALNAQYLASTGAALLVATADEGVAEADRLLHDPQARESMRYAALHAARPHAASLIADRILNRAAVTPYALRTTPYVDTPSLSTR
jgi:processive 1,2-diacylglycerol beta-glucosyltransferase